MIGIAQVIEVVREHEVEEDAIEIIECAVTNDGENFFFYFRRIFGFTQCSSCSVNSSEVMIGGRVRNAERDTEHQVGHIDVEHLKLMDVRLAACPCIAAI